MIRTVPRGGNLWALHWRETIHGEATRVPHSREIILNCCVNLTTIWQMIYKFRSAILHLCLLFSRFTEQACWNGAIGLWCLNRREQLSHHATQLVEGVWFITTAVFERKTKWFSSLRTPVHFWWRAEKSLCMHIGLDSWSHLGTTCQLQCCSFTPAHGAMGGGGGGGDGGTH